MSKSTLILRNLTSNWVGFAVNAAVTLILTPFILSRLGVARYGVWIVTSSVIGCYGFMDMGFRDGVTQYLTRHLAVRDYTKGSECISTALTVLAGLGVLLASISIGAAYLAPRLFHLPPSVENEAFWCILMIGFASAVGCVFYPFSAVFTAIQRFDLSNMITIGTRFLTAGSVFLAVKMGYGLMGVSAATCGGSLIDYLVRWRVAKYLVPDLKSSRSQANWKNFREIGSFGVWNFLISISSYIYQHMPTFLIGAFMPVAAVGHYALASRFSQQINATLSPAGQVFYPAATALHAQRDQVRLEHLYHTASRLMLLAMIPIVLITTFWAKDFYRLWIGEKYLAGAPFHSVALLLQVLLIRTVTYHTSNIAGQILLGAGQVRPLAIANILGSLLLNVAGSLILIGPCGLLGVALSAAMVGVAVDLIAVPFILQRLVGLSVKDFIQAACPRPMTAGILQAVIIGCIRLMGEARDWPTLLIQGTIAGVALVTIALMVGLTAKERYQYLGQPIRRFLRKTVLCGVADR